MPAIWPSPGRTVCPECGSGDVRHGVIGEGQGLVFGPGRIGAVRVARLGCRIPHAQVFEDPCDDIGIVDERDDAHGGAAVGALERIDLVNFLNQPGPAGFTPTIVRQVVNDRNDVRVIVLGSQPSRAPRTVGVIAVVAHLLEGERAADHVAGTALPTIGIVGFGADAVVMAARAEVTGLAGVGEQVVAAALIAIDACEPLMQIAAGAESLEDLGFDSPPDQPGVVELNCVVPNALIQRAHPRVFGRVSGD